MKIVIGGILGGLIVVSIAIGFVILSDNQYEIVEKETMHPCQLITFDYFEIFYELRIFKESSPTLQEMKLFDEKYGELVDESIDKFDKNIIKYNCKETESEWNTDEFKVKLKFLAEYGFLP